MFLRSHSSLAPWTVVRSNDKKRGRLEALRFVLHQLEYPEKDLSLLGEPDPLIVGPPDVVSSEAGERKTRWLTQRVQRSVSSWGASWP